MIGRSIAEENGADGQAGSDCRPSGVRGVGYTADHARLLPRLRWVAQWPDPDGPLRPEQVVPDEDGDTGDVAWPAFAVDPTRPYGDMTEIALDMAEALDLPLAEGAGGDARLSPEVEARLDALHQTMPAALRVLVLHSAAT